MTIDGTDPEIIERILRIEIDAMVERHKHGKHLFGTLAKFGPGFGLMATLIAQVAMFRNLAGDAGVIGQALAIALTGTLYGCMLQNLVAGPISEKLALRSAEEAFAKEIILQGVLSIQAGNNPRVVEMQLGRSQVIPWHYHSEIQDTFYAISGTLRLRMRDPDEVVSLAPGQTHAVSPRRPHSVENAGEVSAVFLILQGLGEHDFVVLTDC